MPVLGRRPSCRQAEPPRLQWVLRLGEASQAPAVPGIKTRSQWGSPPEPAAAPRPPFQVVQLRRKGKPRSCCRVSTSQGNPLAAGKGFPQTERVGGRAATSELPAGRAGCTSDGTHPACPHVPVGRCLQPPHQPHNAGRPLPLTGDK